MENELPDNYVVREDHTAPLADDILFPEFDRTQERYWHHWRLAETETLLGDGESFVSFTVGDAQGRTLWNSQRAELTITEERVLMRLFSFKSDLDDPAVTWSTTGHCGQVRYDWVTSASLTPAKRLAPGTLDLTAAYRDGVAGRWRFNFPRKQAASIERIKGLVEDARQVEPAVPIGQRIAA